MEKSESKKLIPLYLQELFLKKTDKNHFIRMPDILSFLESKNINADRRTVYSAITNLNLAGFTIKGKQERGGYKYHHPERLFSIEELKFLVDSIATSRFLTDRKSKELITKIKTLASEYEITELNRDIITHRKIKSMNDRMFDNLDRIYKAIDNNRQISFQYMRYNADKKLVVTDKKYIVSPCAVSLSAENYYLIAFNADLQKILHFRIDKIKSISILDETRLGIEEYRNFNVIDYSLKAFNMYGGKEETVTIEANNSLIGVFIERFGEMASIRPQFNKKDTFVARIKVMKSPQFYAWIFALGKDARIISPDSVVSEYLDMIKMVRSEYQ